MMEINQKMVELTVRDVCKKYFDFDFDKLNIPVEINGRLSRSLGRMVYSLTKNKPVSLQFSKKLLDGSYKIETVESVIKHEVTHLVLFCRNEPFGDGCSNFEKTLKEIGGTSTKTIMNNKIYTAKCKCCGKTVAKVDSNQKLGRILKNNISACCHSDLKKGEIIYKKDNTVFINKDAGEILKKNIKKILE